MFRRVLVANRGEIAVRVLRTLREMGIDGVAVYSDADREAPHRRHAAQSMRLGPAPPSQSYLRGDRILEAARRSGAEAIHPGYGFLSENADFAQSVLDAGLAWIGPPPAAMRELGDKVSARSLAHRLGVPIAQGSPGALADAPEASRVARDVGYPVILKAAAGGGGIGMRVVRRPEEMADQFQAAASVAQNAFGNGALFLEKYLERPRHIELQIIGDRHGAVVHLGERECSIQRRHQKLVEESPSPALTDADRSRLGELGVKLARAAGYHNAGTLEFLHQDGRFYFNEVNARLQVEHPVTEMVYGVDLVREQVRVAAGEALSWRQADLRPRGHAIEVRLNAEDPLRDYLPTPGFLRRWRLSGNHHVRVDAGVEEGFRVPAQYDSLLAKIIAWGEDRPQAIERLEAALAESEIEGTVTNLGLHRVLVRDEAFRRGELSTRFLEERNLVDRLRAEHAQGRLRAMLLATALATAPRGGLGVLQARSNRPRRLEAHP
jgi:acetyl-CoA carboxylase biotin carboxylase subunit